MKGLPIAILITVSSLLTGCGSHQFECVEGRGCDGRTIVCVCITNEANGNCDEGVFRKRCDAQNAQCICYTGRARCACCIPRL